MNPLSARLSRPEVYGVIGAFLLYFTLGLLNVFTVPLWKPDDEPRHAAYAMYVAEGRIPRVTEVMPTERLGIEPLPRTNIVCAANHPPLYYAIVGPGISWGTRHDAVSEGMYLARVLTLLMGAVGVGYAYALMREIAPRKPHTTLLALTLLPLFPSFINYMSLVYNDALAFATASGALYHLTRAFTRGPTRREWAWFALWACLVALTRFSGLLVLAPALVGWVAAHALRGEGPIVARASRGVAQGVAVLAAVLASSGWFYWHNYTLYGDVTGAQEIFDTLERKTREPFYVHLVSIKPWSILHDHLWTRFGGSPTLLGAAKNASHAWSAVAAIGLLLTARAAWRSPERPSWRDPGLAAFGFGVLAISAVTLPVFEFYARGGNIYPRYYFPVLWVVALVAATGFTAFRSRGPALWALVYGGLLSALGHLVYVETFDTTAKAARDWAWTAALQRAGASVDVAWLAADALVALATVGLTLSTAAVLALYPEEQPATPSNG